MKKMIRLGLCLGLLSAALTCTALAADDEYTTNIDGTVTYDGGSYSASYTGTQKDNQYVLLVVKGTVDSEGAAHYSVTEDTIVYIDQQPATAAGVSFENWIPMSTPDCVVLLGGVFDKNVPSPVVLGTLKGQGVSVSGRVTTTASSIGNATVTLYKSDGTFVLAATADNFGEFVLTSVPVGEKYLLKASKDGFVSIPVDVDMTLVESNITIDDIVIYGGDINENGSINVDDLGFILADYGLGDDRIYPLSDITGNGYVNVDDLSYLLDGYGKNDSSVN